MTDPQYTHIGLVVDRSGSMSPIAQDMNGGIRQLIKDQGAALDVVKIDICTFDTVIDFVRTDATPEECDEDFLVPRGGTALNDAIGLMINRLGNKFKAMPEEKRPSNVIVVVVTDGMENSSREYTHAQVKEMVERQTNEWGWTFTYLAANVDAFATGGAYGFAPNQTMNYRASKGGTQNMWAAASANVTRSGLGDDSGYLQSERDSAMEES